MFFIEDAGEPRIIILRREKRSKEDQVQGDKHQKKEENQKQTRKKNYTKIGKRGLRSLEKKSTTKNRNDHFQGNN